MSEGAAPDREPSPHRKWYALKRWRLIRKAQLQKEPWCVICRRFGRSRAATIADHVIPHRGDPHLFWHGKLQSLCKPCHDEVKMAQETQGFSRFPDDDGWPSDPAHPFNRASDRSASMIPKSRKS